MSATLLDTEELAPADEAGIADVVAQAAAQRRPLEVEGLGSKRGALRPMRGGQRLSLRNHAGITDYRPQEMVLTARAGTPMPEIEAAVAASGQMLLGEPPALSWIYGLDGASSLGGMVSTNLSGPRRISGGAMRDHVLGIRAVNGRGEVFRSGGRVHKNVTGLDLCKLLAGAYGTLGVLTEITLKVQPRPPSSGTLLVPVAGIAEGIGVLSRGLGSPFGVSGAALLPLGAPALGVHGPSALLRIEDFAESVRYRLESLRRIWGVGSLLPESESIALWREVCDARLLAPRAGDAIWRVSVRPSRAPAVAAAVQAAFDARFLLDWGGGLLWIAGPAQDHGRAVENHQVVMEAALRAGGVFTLMRGPDSVRLAEPVVPREPEALARLAARVKAVLDPEGVLNPGRIRSAPGANESF